MAIERMPEQDTEIKRKTTNKEVENFLSLGIKDYGKAIARWSLKPSRESTKPLGTESLIMAKSLSTIGIEDSNLNERVTEILEKPEKMTMDGIALATAVFVGKAEAKNKGFLTPKEKKGLSKLTNTVVDGALDKITGARGKVLRWTTTFAVLATACTATAESTIELTTTKPVVTEVAAIPTASPEVVNSLNESAQRLIDEAFEGLGIHSVSLVGAGILKNSSGDEFVLFTSKLPDSINDEDLDFLIIGGIDGNNQIETIKGLVIDETKAQGPIFEFIAVTFNPETRTFVLEEDYVRTNTETGEIEIYQDGAWQALNGPDETIEDIQVKLGGGVLAAPALPTPTVPPPVEWNFSQELPEIHSENARFEAGEDGTDRIIFTHEESEYIVEITKPDSAIDIDDVEVTEGTLEVKFFSKPDESVRAKYPIITYRDISTNEPLAWYDIKANEWIYRYETLFERDEYPPKPTWLYYNDGFVISWEGGEEEIVSRYVVFAGKVKRVFTEKVPDKGEFVEIYWMTVTYGNEDETVDVLLFSEEDGDDQFKWGFKVLIPENDSEYYGPQFIPQGEQSSSQEEILSALRESAIVHVNLFLLKKEDLAELATYKNQFTILSSNPINRVGYLEHKFLEAKEKLMNAVESGNYEGVENDIQVGTTNLWIFVPPK